MMLFTVTSFASIDVTQTINKADSIVNKASDLYNSVEQRIDTVNVNINTTLDSIVTSESFNEYESDIKSFLISTAKALGVGITEVFDVIVKQQIVKSIAYTIGLLFLAFATFKSFKYAFDGKETTPLILISIALLIFTIYFSSTHLYTIVTGYVNPRFGAYQDIITFIQQIK